ncbi:thiosulfate ABC transporter substrate-binding protein CysP [Orrella sp. 11846]|uniref:thiosulfate ABC transporter substrate-binding protein CysP n=1 Tax=Orrella sp. 11846 TaxID=3409913 RepID=UPI003B5C3C1F
MLKKFLLASTLTLASLGVTTAQAQQTELLNASYDIARELFGAYNPKFAEHWKATTGNDVQINQSHAGSSRQAQDILKGKQADLITFNQVTDVEILAKNDFIAKDWASRFPHNSSPYYSTIAFLVRKDNPKNIQNWDDLIRDDVRLVFPNPKTSGNARYTYLAAWLFANELYEGDEEKTKAFMKKFLNNVDSFPTGGRAATTAFSQGEQGDVLLTFESEVINIANSDEFAQYEFGTVVPPVSILAEFPVSVVDRVADRRGTRDISEAYLNYLYAPEIQELLTTFNYRVRDPQVVAATKAQFPELRLFNPNESLGTWDDIQAQHFGSGGVLDQLLADRSTK